MAAQDSALVAVRDTLSRLGKHRGLAAGAARLRTTQVDIGPLLALRVVQDRAFRDGLPPDQVVLEVVREVADRLDPTDRLIADAALALGLLRAEPPAGIELDRLYAPDLGARREYLTVHWRVLHESLGATTIPTPPTVRTLRATPERRAFGALAALLTDEAEAADDPRASAEAGRPRIGTVTVIGAAVIDHQYITDHIPTAGGRPARGRFEEHLGGKGLNRAVAAARLGFEVRLITAIGDDPAGQRILRYLRREGVDVDLVKVVAGEPTPVAAVIMTSEGAIATIGGADQSVCLMPQDLNKPAARQAITDADAVLLTFEQPIPVIQQAMRLLRTADAPWLLVQPTPPIDTPQYVYEYLRRVDYLIGSSQELGGLLTDPADGQDTAAQLLALGVDTVCTVEGLECRATSDADSVLHVGRFAAAQLRESIGARAAFMAALARRLVLGEGRADHEAFRWATAAMAATQSLGDIPEAMPDPAEIDRIVGFSPR
ncbi:PfkB family carbohydrate kinase [Nocardia takedensis]